MELLQPLISIGPDNKNIVNVSAPHLRFPGGGLQGTYLEVFHEDVSQNGTGENPLLLLSPVHRRPHQTGSTWTSGKVPQGCRGQGWGCWFVP